MLTARRTAHDSRLRRRLSGAALCAAWLLLSACAPIAPPTVHTTVEGERFALLRDTASMPRAKALQHLMHNLVAANPSARAAAARVLGYGYMLDPPQLHALATALRDPVAEVRQAASLALLTQLPRLEARFPAPFASGHVAGAPPQTVGLTGIPTASTRVDPADLARTSNAATLDALNALRSHLQDQLRGTPPSPVAPDVHRILDQTHLGTPFPMPTGSMIPQ